MVEEQVRQMGPSRQDVETFITFDRLGTGNGGVDGATGCLKPLMEPPTAGP